MGTGWFYWGRLGNSTHNSLHIYEAEALAYIITYHDEIWLKKAPIGGTRSVVELDAIDPFSGPQFKEEGLVRVAQKRDLGSSGQPVFALGYATTAVDVFLFSC